jgi:hypothetical protein
MSHGVPGQQNASGVREDRRQSRVRTWRTMGRFPQRPRTTSARLAGLLRRTQRARRGSLQMSPTSPAPRRVPRASGQRNKQDEKKDDRAAHVLWLRPACDVGTLQKR